MSVTSRIPRHRAIGPLAVAVFLAMVALWSEIPICSSASIPSSLDGSICSIFTHSKCRIDLEKCSNVLKLGNAIGNAMEGLLEYAEVDKPSMPRIIYYGLANQTRIVSWPEMLENYKGALSAAKNIAVGRNGISLRKNFNDINRILLSTNRTMQLTSKTADFTRLKFVVREKDSWREALRHQQNLYRKVYLLHYLQEFFADVRKLLEAFIGVACPNIHSVETMKS